MKQFHIDEPREIGKQKVKITKKDMMVKDKLQEKLLRKKIREIIKEDLTEGKVWYSVYHNKRGSEANVYDNSDLGKSPRDGYYVDVDNRYDMEFKNKAELDKWLKKEKYEHVGVDDRYQF